MLEENRCLPGNGNGNKMNLRVEILEGLLASLNDTTSAKMNSLRQTIRRNQMDQADTARKSLDVMRQVFQADINDEIKQVLDRHMRTTFSPAFENLKRHHLDVTDNDINELCRSILDGAKLCFQPIPRPKGENNFMEYDTLTPPMTESGNGFGDSRRVYESDGGESDASCMSQASSIIAQSPLGTGSGMKKRGRPRKTDVDCGRSGSPILSGISPISLDQGAKWDPERIGVNTRYILGSKVNKILSLGHRGHVYAKYPLIFRYVADDDDKAWLFDRNLTTRLNGKVLVMVLDDVQEIAQIENLPGSTLNDLQRCSFLAQEQMVGKMKMFMRAPFERLKKRIIFPQQIGSFSC